MAAASAGRPPQWSRFCPRPWRKNQNYYTSLIARVSERRNAHAHRLQRRSCHGQGPRRFRRLLARRLAAVYVRIDTIEQPVMAASSNDIADTGYRVAHGVARDNLLLGRDVVADCVNPLNVTRDAWRWASRIRVRRSKWFARMSPNIGARRNAKGGIPRNSRRQHGSRFAGYNRGSARTPSSTQPGGTSKTASRNYWRSRTANSAASPTFAPSGSWPGMQALAVGEI